MINIIQEVNVEHNMSISMRIGIHTGDVIAGITGKNIVRYDIYGNDVYIANSMESNGKAGHIAVSNATKIMIKAYRPTLFEFEEFKIVEVIDSKIEMFLLKS